MSSLSSCSSVRPPTGPSFPSPIRPTYQTTHPYSSSSQPPISHASSSSSSHSAGYDDEEDDENDFDSALKDSETTSVGGDTYDEEDHRRLLFSLTRGEKLTPQVELALRLMDEMKIGKSASGDEGSVFGSPGSPIDDDDEEEEEEEEDLESVDEYEYGGYAGFPIASPATVARKDEDSEANPYAAYRPEPGLGRVRKWLDGLQVDEMVA